MDSPRPVATRSLKVIHSHAETCMVSYHFWRSGKRRRADVLASLPEEPNLRQEEEQQEQEDDMEHIEAFTGVVPWPVLNDSTTKP
jgi:hypothetical protein